MFRLILATIVFSVLLGCVSATNCDGNCPGGCGSCPCGSTANRLNPAEWCAKFSSWDQGCCQCIMEHESGGNANAMNQNSGGSYDIGLWQINSVNWGTCNSGHAPCNPDDNLRCAIDAWRWGGESFRLWSTCSGCGCCAKGDHRAAAPAPHPAPHPPPPAPHPAPHPPATTSHAAPHPPPAPPAGTSTLCVKATGGLHYRSCAGLSCGILGTIPNGHAVQVNGPTENANGYCWDEITYASTRGWAASEYLGACSTGHLAVEDAVSSSSSSSGGSSGVPVWIVVLTCVAGLVVGAALVAAAALVYLKKRQNL